MVEIVYHVNSPNARGNLKKRECGMTELDAFRFLFCGGGEEFSAARHF